MTTDIQSGSDYQVITVWDNERYADEIIDAYKKIMRIHILRNGLEIKKEKGFKSILKKMQSRYLWGKKEKDIRPFFDEIGCGHIWKQVLQGVALINKKGKMELYGAIQINGNQIKSGNHVIETEEKLWTSMPTLLTPVKPIIGKIKELSWWGLIFVTLYYIISQLF